MVANGIPGFAQNSRTTRIARGSRRRHSCL